MHFLNLRIFIWTGFYFKILTVYVFVKLKGAFFTSDCHFYHSHGLFLQIEIGFLPEYAFFCVFEPYLKNLNCSHSMGFRIFGSERLNIRFRNFLINEAWQLADRRSCDSNFHYFFVSRLFCGHNNCL